MVKLNKIMKALALAGALSSAASAWALSSSEPAAPAPGAAAAAPAAGASSPTAGLVAPQVQVPTPFAVSGPQNATPVLNNGMEPKLREAAELNGDIQILTLKGKKKVLEDALVAKPANQGGNGGASGGDSSVDNAQSLIKQRAAQEAQANAERQRQAQEARAAAIARANTVEVTNVYGLNGNYLADLIVGGETRITAGAGSMLPNGQIVRQIGLDGIIVQLPGAPKSTPHLLLIPVSGSSAMAGTSQQVAQQQRPAASPTQGPMGRFGPVITGPGVKTPILLPQN